VNEPPKEHRGPRIHRIDSWNDLLNVDANTTHAEPTSTAFLYRGQGSDQWSLQPAITQIAKKFNLTVAESLDLEAILKGRPLKEVQELLGHKSISQTERYSHLAPERLREAVATLEFNTTSTQSPAAATQVPVSIAGR
jgi:integrase